MGLDCFSVSQQSACVNDAILDAVILMDSSSSISDEDYTQFMNAVSSSTDGGIQGPGGTNFGFVQFASLTRTEVQMYDGSTQEDWAVAIQNAEQMGGATWTRYALQTVLADQFGPGMDLGGNRVKIVILITDGVPSLGQDPCDLAERFTDSGIFIIPVAISTDNIESIEASLVCLATHEGGYVVTFNGYTDASANLFGGVTLSSIIQPLLINDDCSNGPVPEDYLGHYSQSSLINGYPSFINIGSDAILTWSDGSWVFSTPSQSDTLSDPSSDSSLIFPATGTRNWLWNFAEEIEITIDDTVTCVPTKSPSFHRTDVSDPTITPTANPALHPTNVQTNTPSTENILDPCEVFVFGSDCLTEGTENSACTVDVETPFSYVYYVSDETLNGKQIYESDNGHRLTWTGEEWVFQHSLDGAMTANERNADNPYPASGLSWTFMDFNGNGAFFDDVPTFCMDTFTVPSGAPTTPPCDVIEFCCGTSFDGSYAITGTFLNGLPVYSDGVNQLSKDQDGWMFSSESASTILISSNQTDTSIPLLQQSWILLQAETLSRQDEFDCSGVEGMCSNCAPETTTQADEYVCRTTSCGCPGNWRSPWCTESNSAGGAWCALSLENCDACGGVYCNGDDEVLPPTTTPDPDSTSETIVYTDLGQGFCGDADGNVLSIRLLFGEGDRCEQYCSQFHVCHGYTINFSSCFIYGQYDELETNSAIEEVCSSITCSIVQGFSPNERISLAIPNAFASNRCFVKDSMLLNIDSGGGEITGQTFATDSGMSEHDFLIGIFGQI